MALLLLLVSIGAVASTSGASPGAAKAHRLAAQPNIIVIESDDQPTIAFNHHAMPKTFRRVVDHGTRLLADGRDPAPVLSVSGRFHDR